MDIMSALAAIPGAGPLLPYAAVAVAVCAAVATALPSPASRATGFYPAIYALVNLLALNVGHARNAGAPAPAPAPATPATPAPASPAPASPATAPQA